MLQSCLFTAFLAFRLLYTSHAQSTSSACGNYSLIIDSLEAFEAAQTCTTIAGDLVIEYVAGLPSIVEFPNLEQVNGSFLSLNFDENILASELSAPKLTTVVNDFYISRWVNLSTIDMPLLSTVNRIRLNNLPSLTSANVLSSLETIENNYEIWNTSLTEITNEKLQYAVFVEIYNNPRLEKLEMTALRNASYDIALRRNRPDMEVSFPELVEVWYFEMQQIASLEIPKLESVIGHFIVNSSSLKTLEAPSLKTIGTWYDPTISITSNFGLKIQNCPNLASISFPELVSVQLDIIITNNTALEVVDFPKLERITANVGIEGSFTNVTMPALERVGGVFYLGSDESGFDCSDFSQLRSSGGIRGEYSCPQYKEPPNRQGAFYEGDPGELDSWLGWLNGTNGNAPSGGTSINPLGIEAIAGICIGAAVVLQAF
ncbi:hypothetical protein ABW19_dt0206498 [Dactylella cylindrospora]|nr:hypothetical protein ABW19_dt0206498 [Dactylella cylindrospora]